MKLTFRGWSREVNVHTHPVTPVSQNKKAYVTEAMGPVKWDDASTVLGRIDDVKLTGSFLVEVSMEQAELTSWLKAFAKEHPESALKLIAEAQAEALLALVAQNTAEVQ